MNVTLVEDVVPVISVIAFDAKVTVRGGVAGAVAPVERVIVPTKPLRLDSVREPEAFDPDGNEM